MTSMCGSSYASVSDGAVVTAGGGSAAKAFMAISKGTSTPESVTRRMGLMAGESGDGMLLTERNLLWGTDVGIGWAEWIVIYNKE